MHREPTVSNTGSKVVHNCDIHELLAALVTSAPVKLDGFEPPHIVILRKYVWVVLGVAQLSSEPNESRSVLLVHVIVRM